MKCKVYLPFEKVIAGKNDGLDMRVLNWLNYVHSLSTSLSAK